MAKASLVLRDYKTKDLTTIHLVVRYNNQKLRYSTGHKVSVKDWNGKSQQLTVPRTGDENLIQHRKEFNSRLKNLRIDVENAVHDLEKKEPLTKENIRFTLDVLFGKIAPQPKEPEESQISLFEFIKSFIEEVTDRAPATLSVYNSTLTHLMDYDKNLNFDDITLSFYNKFKKSLLKKGQSDNTIGKYIKTLKTFLYEAEARGLEVPQDFKSSKFKVHNKATPKIYLNEEELEQIKNVDLSSKPNLDNARDLFLLGAYTGLRYSDYHQIRPEAIYEGRLRIMSKKMKREIAIPVNSVVSEILEKRGGQPPRTIANQTLNRLLKEIGFLAGIDRPEAVSKTVNNQMQTEYTPKYNLIATHTARRSFCTNQYKKGIPAISIMAISGHLTEKSFLRYLRLDPIDHAKIIEMYWEQSPKKSVLNG